VCFSVMYHVLMIEVPILPAILKIDDIAIAIRTADKLRRPCVGTQAFLLFV
jgi:hypothetical protein